MTTPMQGVIFGVAFLAAILYATSGHGAENKVTAMDIPEVRSSALTGDKGQQDGHGHVHQPDHKPNPCRHWQKNPVQCVQHPDCSFCIQPNFCKFRCDTPENLAKHDCSAENILNEITLNSTLSSGTSSTPIRLPIVPGRRRAVNITITFDMTDVPFDVYFNVDFTGSMTDDRLYIINHADDFVLVLGTLFPNTKLGFGSFTDKAKEPFGNVTTRYSFWHILDLSPMYAVANLRDTIANVPHFIGRGIDLLDAQLDAWTQIAICEDEIGGWRPQEARKLIYTITDGDYHIAPDGLAGGITTPHNGECAVDANKKYLGIDMDYPSISQFTSILIDTDTTLIVAYLADFHPSYVKLTAGLPFTSELVPLSESTETIADLFLQAYGKVKDRFGIQQSKISEDTPEISIRYFTDCAATGSPAIVEERANCTTLNNSTVVTFTVEIELDSCPDNEASWVQTVRINPFGLPFLYQDIELNVICQSESCPPCNAGTKFSNC